MWHCGFSCPKRLTLISGIYVQRACDGGCTTRFEFPCSSEARKENIQRRRNCCDPFWSDIYWWSLAISGGNKRDKLKGTNAHDSQFFADFRRFLLIFACPGNCSISGAQIFAENRRKPQIFAENRRKPQIFAETPFVPFSLSLLVPPYNCWSGNKVYEHEQIVRFCHSVGDLAWKHHWNTRKFWNNMFSMFFVCFQMRYRRMFCHKLGSKRRFGFLGAKEASGRKLPLQLSGAKGPTEPETPKNSK